MVAICLSFLSRLPYFNLFITDSVIAAIMWITVTVLWHVSFRIQFGLALGLLICSAASLLRGFPVWAENLGNAAYFMLVLGVMTMVRSRFR